MRESDGSKEVCNCSKLKINGESNSRAAKTCKDKKEVRNCKEVCIDAIRDI